MFHQSKSADAKTYPVVVTHNGRSSVLKVRTSTTIGNIKSMIAYRFGLTPEKIGVSIAGKQPPDEATFGQCSVPRNSLLQIMTCIQGGMQRGINSLLEKAATDKAQGQSPNAAGKPSLLKT